MVLADRQEDPISNAADPNNPIDSNNNVTWRCNNSPTGKHASRIPDGQDISWRKYSQANFCDLMGVWVDPDTGDWYGLVHNEFTPAPYGDALHFDAIDLAISADQGNTWKIKETIISSPYPTIRNDTKAFPEATYIWGNGDQRLFVDLASGYFYINYGSRVVDKKGTWEAFYAHAARSPISSKFGAGSWQKWYDGKWQEPGLGGKESNIVPTHIEPYGYTPPKKEYKPTNKGTAQEQIKAGLIPPTTPLFWMDVTYNAYLGLWIGEPNHVDMYKSNNSQIFYATDDLTTQKWRVIGDTGNYKTRSNYRFLIDSVSRTSQTIVGKDFRAYCSFGCSNGSNSEYVNIAIEGPVANVIDSSKQYRISATGKELGDVAEFKKSKGKGHGWAIKPTGDGAYTLSSKHGYLGVDATPEGRKWGTIPDVGGAPDVGRQWWIIPSRDLQNRKTGTFRIVNRHSGLVLALGEQVETVPGRFWDAKGGVGGHRKAEEQEVRLSVV